MTDQSDTRRPLGWLRGLPDFRDYTIEQAEAATKLQKTGTRSSVRTMLSEIGTIDAPLGAQPPVVDLRPWMSPIEDRGPCCTGPATPARSCARRWGR